MDARELRGYERSREVYDSVSTYIPAFKEVDQEALVKMKTHGSPREIAEAYAKDKYKKHELGIYYRYRIAALFELADAANVVAMDILLKHYGRADPLFEMPIVFDRNALGVELVGIGFRQLSNEFFMAKLPKWAEVPDAQLARVVLKNGAKKIT